MHFQFLSVPDVTLTAPSRLLYEGTSQTLTCTATLHLPVNSDIAISIHWTTATNSDRVIISSPSSERSPFISTLTLSPLVISDAGLYSCEATVYSLAQNTTDNITQHSQELNLKVTVVFSLSPPPITEQNGPLTSYTLSCSPSLPSQPLTIQPESRPSLTVTGLTPNTDYTYFVTADNSRGSGPPENFTFTTMEDCKICSYFHDSAVVQNALFAVKYFQLHLSGLLTTCSDLVVNDNIIVLT